MVGRSRKKSSYVNHGVGGGEGGYRRFRSDRDGKRPGKRPKAGDFEKPCDGVLVDSREMDSAITLDPRDGAVNRPVRTLSEMSFGIRSNPHLLSTRGARSERISVNQSDRYTEKNYQS